MISLSGDQARLLRLRAQQLIPGSSDAVTDTASIVKRLGGIQAQDMLAAKLAVRVRGAGMGIADVERALAQERSVVRIWGPRGTLHLLAAEDIGWLLPLLGPIFIAGSQRRYVELGLNEDILARGTRIIRDALANQGPLTRAEIVEQLALHGLHIEGQARPYLIARAALEGFICLGPDRGAEPTYVLLSDWIHREYPSPQEEAPIVLLRRYLKAYGPATPADFAAWSGLPMSMVRTAWQHVANELIAVQIADKPVWMLQSIVAELDQLLLSVQSPIVRLLPAFDNYLLGYKNRILMVAPQHTKRINAGGGMLHPALLIDGRVVGTWKIKRQKNALRVEVAPFDQLTPEALAALETEAADIARFLGSRATLHVMVPP